jgi:iron-sulfur cluster repair protein YtfE (RIC family)
MDAISMLEEQHEKAMSLFEQFEHAETSAQKKALFEELADELAVHTTIEEKVFYPAVYANDTEEVLSEAVQEHLSVKRLIVDLMELSPADEEFDAKLSVMKEQVEHHVKEEREQLFPKVRKAMSKETLAELGSRMQGLFTREMKAGPSRNISDQIDEAPRLQ